MKNYTPERDTRELDACLRHVKLADYTLPADIVSQVSIVYSQPTCSPFRNMFRPRNQATSPGSVCVDAPARCPRVLLNYSSFFSFFSFFSFCLPPLGYLTLSRHLLGRGPPQHCGSAACLWRQPNKMEVWKEKGEGGGENELRRLRFE